ATPSAGEKTGQQILVTRQAGDGGPVGQTGLQCSGGIGIQDRRPSALGHDFAVIGPLCGQSRAAEHRAQGNGGPWSASGCPQAAGIPVAGDRPQALAVEYPPCALADDLGLVRNDLAPVLGETEGAACLDVWLTAHRELSSLGTD